MALSMRAAFLISAVLAAGALSSCAGSAAVSGPSVEGRWGDTRNTSSPSLDFSADGRVSGTDGCNTLTGRWEQDGASVSLDGVTSTLIGCPGVDTWLSAAAAGEIDGENLALFNDDGDPIGTLQR